MNVEQPVNALEVLHRQLDALFPNRKIFRIAGLQFNQLLPTGFAHGRIAGRSFVSLFVDTDNLADRIPLECWSIEQILPTPDHHAELRSPIADVIVADDFVTEKLRNARKSVAQNGAANVTDVHRFGHIG